MSLEVGIPILVCVATTIAALVLYRKLSNTKLVLADAHSRLDAGRKGYSNLKEEHKSCIKSLDDAKSLLKDMEQTVSDSRNKYSKVALSHENEIAGFQTDIRKLNLKIDHLEEENNALKSQLHNMESEQKEQINEIKSDLESKLRAKYKNLDEQDRAQKAQLQEDKAEKVEKEKEISKLRKKVAHLTSILKKVDPEENRKNKRKARHMEQLYQSMKGLRDLADERNRNWEVALTKLSNHVLEKPLDESNSQKQGIGATVGAALEKIGTTLVVDSEADEKKILKELSGSKSPKTVPQKNEVALEQT